MVFFLGNFVENQQFLVKSIDPDKRIPDHRNECMVLRHVGHLCIRSAGKLNNLIFCIEHSDEAFHFLDVAVQFFEGGVRLLGVGVRFLDVGVQSLGLSVRFHLHLLFFVTSRCIVGFIFSGTFIVLIHTGWW